MGSTFGKSVSNSVLDAATTQDPFKKRKKAIGILIGGALLLVIGLILIITGLMSKADLAKILVLIGIIIAVASMALVIPGIIMIITATKKIKTPATKLKSEKVK